MIAKATRAMNAITSPFVVHLLQFFFLISTSVNHLVALIVKMDVAVMFRYVKVLYA